MHFAPDTVESLEFAVLLGNTHKLASRSGADELSTADHVHALIMQFRFSGRIDRDNNEVVEVRAVRDRIREVWKLTRDDAAVEINAMLAEAKALPFLARHGDFDWHLHANDPEAPLAERIQAEVGLALVDVVRSDAMWRLRRCQAPDCEGLMADLSRNGSRRFCSIRCGNRMNQIAYRERQAAGN
ncbi:CGNR zinc finger domain-containing protein [Salinibacterium sp. NSLL150]|uniref:CGNR zinc finger domain-containing protein n=1 Tax=unclassified Salinibacterium TaxID=2632331 RepID=UPI0018CDC8BA|nr:MULTISPECIES: CGNR zinc finger domain-containing protein [unclassified Salinibacterium]MBH0098717.1 CGNR zinc finger domain-containing protein [Salinibacterium sp. NSLL35]MBH0101472.1 CGNR zinc finger domain-containing protein [Salinibacterium sp. NSLL150]MBH0104231.1 CGNR zinc finger domain-containing protein [Salinibacterium sp. NSLL16]MBH0106992.1 CGNR zinc finger domain-containing protein [Salinibacterium sp. NSLL17]MBH0109236.1 CGNR zinc finger domain-containing protein [Salinibacteriu